MKKLNAKGTPKFLLAILFILFGLGMNKASAQSTTSPDTVCAGETGVEYYVTNTAGSTYQWVIKNGTKASGGTTNKITVDWSSTSGTDTLKVVEINANGCPGDTVRLAVYRMPRPTATLSGQDSICYNGSSVIKVTLTGVGPWDFTYSDGTTNKTVTGVTTTTYNIPVTNLTSTKNYSMVSVKNSRQGCTGTVSGTATVKVFPKPSTSGIFHN